MGTVPKKTRSEATDQIVQEPLDEFHAKLRMRLAEGRRLALDLSRFHCLLGPPSQSKELLSALRIVSPTGFPLVRRGATQARRFVNQHASAPSGSRLFDKLCEAVSKRLGEWAEDTIRK